MNATNIEAMRLVTKALGKLGTAQGMLADYLAKYEKGPAALALKEVEAHLEKAQETLMQ